MSHSAEFYYELLQSALSERLAETKLLREEAEKSKIDAERTNDDARKKAEANKRLGHNLIDKEAALMRQETEFIKRQRKWEEQRGEEMKVLQQTKDDLKRTGEDLDAKLRFIEDQKLAVERRIDNLQSAGAFLKEVLDSLKAQSMPCRAGEGAHVAQSEQPGASHTPGKKESKPVSDCLPDFVPVESPDLANLDPHDPASHPHQPCSSRQSDESEAMPDTSSYTGTDTLSGSDTIRTEDLSSADLNVSPDSKPPKLSDDASLSHAQAEPPLRNPQGASTETGPGLGGLDSLDAQPDDSENPPTTTEVHGEETPSLPKVSSKVLDSIRATNEASSSPKLGSEEWQLPPSWGSDCDSSDDEVPLAEKHRLFAKLREGNATRDNTTTGNEDPAKKAFPWGQTKQGGSLTTDRRSSVVPQSKRTASWSDILRRSASLSNPPLQPAVKKRGRPPGSSKRPKPSLLAQIAAGRKNIQQQRSYPLAKPSAETSSGRGPEEFMSLDPDVGASSPGIDQDDASPFARASTPGDTDPIFWDQALHYPKENGNSEHAPRPEDHTTSGHPSTQAFHENTLPGPPRDPRVRPQDPVPVSFNHRTEDSKRAVPPRDYWDNRPSQIYQRGLPGRPLVPRGGHIGHQTFNASRPRQHAPGVFYPTRGAPPNRGSVPYRGSPPSRAKTSARGRGKPPMHAGAPKGGLDAAVQELKAMFNPTPAPQQI